MINYLKKLLQSGIYFLYKKTYIDQILVVTTTGIGITMTHF